ncbi:DNA repair protein RecN [Peredibacter starrii]|uniref:DNA repair protein RecN n=1 Tax=Peredibacter starrii TaxID=28202 RepID=A0AAX4HRB7_9BACT|nr:AAA family ATPase [Peredibacter starrii]WPU65499.1 AAA family ATPase [Peredibacter starrii]
MDAKFHLKNLVIQNFATFKNQSIRFRPGFNAIIGETGSGKSLVLDALQLILGGRADKKVVRRETECALIEASFTCTDDKVKAFLESEGFPIEGNEIVIKRLIYKNGTTKTYINHLTCTVTFLASFARKFIDLVGQFENQKLLSESYQLYLLDHYSKQLPELSAYQEELRELKALKKEQAELIQSKTHREQRLDYLNFQLQEIEKLNPSSQDEEDLLKKKNLLMNIEKTQKLCYQVKESFDGNDGVPGMLGQIKFLNSLFSKNPDLFQDQMELLSEIDDRIHSLNDIVDRKLNMEIDPADLEGVLDRLDSYQKLKKKFGGNVETILQTQVEFLKEKNTLESLEVNCDELEGKIQSLQKKLMTQADKLHKTRSQFCKKLSTELTQKVRLLKMNGATIRLDLEILEELSETGYSRVQFLAETNPGEGYFKIKDIASGGELSRILLSLRQILASDDSISIFLFDEIDTGIGGDTANSIGKALAEVAAHGQVIAITHLPQIAQFAESLIIVNKDIQSQDKEARTESTVKEISGKMILKEVRSMAQLS